MGDFARGSGGFAEGGRLELRPVAAGRLGRRFRPPRISDPPVESLLHRLNHASALRREPVCAFFLSLLGPLPHAGSCHEQMNGDSRMALADATMPADVLIQATELARCHSGERG